MSGKDDQIEKVGFVESQKNLESSKTSSVSELDINVDELTKTIEERIDQLFRPEVELSFDFEARKEEDKSPISEIISSEAPESRISEDIKKFEPLPEQKVELETPEVSKVAEEPTLLELLERATVAYLSLDWEFTQDNLQAMANSVLAIESKVDPVPETRVLFTILKKLLEWFSSYEQTVSANSLTLFREVLQFLSKTLQRGQKIGDKEQKIINQFCKRFNILKKQYNIKEPDLTMPPVPSEVSVELKVAEGIVETKPEARVVSKITSIQDLELEIRNLRKTLEEENLRLRRIIEILNDRPKLKPLGDRLLKVVHRYESYVDRIQNLEVALSSFKIDFPKGIMSDRDKEKTSPAKTLSEGTFVEPAVAEPDFVGKEKGEVDSHIKEEAVSEAISRPSDEYESVKKIYVFLYQGKYFAIPADQLVKYDQISFKKAGSLMSKGFGTLKDVKPFFKKITHGVRGQWLYKPQQELKSMIFKYVNIRRLFDLPEIKEEYGGVVIFASDGVNNVMFLVDSVIEGDPIFVKEIKPAKNPKLLGVANVDQYKNVDIINIKALA